MESDDWGVHALDTWYLILFSHAKMLNVNG